MTIKSSFSLCGEQCGYIAPSASVLEYQIEGLLCSSGEFNFNRADVGYGDNAMGEI